MIEITQSDPVLPLQPPPQHHHQTIQSRHRQQHQRLPRQRRQIIHRRNERLVRRCRRVTHGREPTKVPPPPQAVVKPPVRRAPWSAVTCHSFFPARHVSPENRPSLSIKRCNRPHPPPHPIPPPPSIIHPPMLGRVPLLFRGDTVLKIQKFFSLRRRRATSSWGSLARRLRSGGGSGGGTECSCDGRDGRRGDVRCWLRQPVWIEGLAALDYTVDEA